MILINILEGFNSKEKSTRNATKFITTSITTIWEAEPYFFIY